VIWLRAAASLLLAVLFIAAAAFAGTAYAAPSSGEPHELVRSLQAVQDGIANGNAEAHGGLPALIRQIGEKFLAADPALWSDPRNGQALVVFLLSGGAPRVARKLPRDRINVDERLFNAALAYVEGGQDEAKELLKDVNPRLIPSSLGGQIALVQGTLLASSDPSRAIERLDDARLLSPGTLVEEAALRREVLLVGQAEDFDKFEFLTFVYIRHYRNSVYAGDFWQRFSSTLTRSSLASDERRFVRVSAMLDQLDRANRLKLYLALSRTALVRGRLALARLAGEQALPLSPEEFPDHERAHLFRGAARALTDDYEGGLAELKAVERSRLPERDSYILDATLQLVLDVRKPTTELPTGFGADNPPPTSARLDLTSSTTTLARAHEQLEQLNLLTKDRRP
jgi:chemotaxis protein MotC